MTIESQLAILHRAELQIAKWEDSKRYSITRALEPENDSQSCERSVITITSEPGCHGASIAKSIAHEFGFQLFGCELVNLIAQSTHLSDELIATLDDKMQSWFEDSLAESMGMDKGYLSLNCYFTNLSKVIFTIAEHGNAVILGRGAAFLIRQDKRLAIRFVAPLDIRVNRIMAEHGYSREQAKEYISAKEKQRSQFIQHHFHADIKDPANYDIVINTASINEKEIIEIVKGFPNRKKRIEKNAGSFAEWPAAIIS